MKKKQAFTSLSTTSLYIMSLKFTERHRISSQFILSLSWPPIGSMSYNGCCFLDNNLQDDSEVQVWDNEATHLNEKRQKDTALS